MICHRFFVNFINSIVIMRFLEYNRFSEGDYMDRISRYFIKPEKLRTSRLLLRPMKVKDTDDMFEYASRSDVTEFLLWAPHDDRSFTKRYLKNVEAAYRRGQFYDWAVELVSENKMIGTCGIADFDLPNSTAEIGYVLNPDYHNRGYATEAVMEVIAYCFNTLNINRVEARYMVGNDASRRVMEKCKMKFEGIKRDGLFVKDGYRDIGTCAILASDFRRMNHQF